MSNKAIVVIDMLNDFVTGSLKCDRAQRIIPPLQKLLESARSKGVPVIYSNDCHYPGIDNELKLSMTSSKIFKDSAGRVDSGSAWPAAVVISVLLR